jgi:cbb3-type cytochrome oxidase subunit 3
LGPGSATLGALVAHGGGSGGELPMTIMLATVLVLIWVALGVVCWIFWRAKKREDVAKRKQEAESEWRNAPSS